MTTIQLNDLIINGVNHSTIYDHFYRSPHHRGIILSEMDKREIKRNPLGLYSIFHLPPIPDSKFKEMSKGLNKSKLLVLMQRFTKDPMDLKNLSYPKLSYGTTFYYYWKIGCQFASM